MTGNMWECGGQDTVVNVTARPAFLKSVIIYGLTALLLSHCSEFSTSDTAKTGNAQASVTLKLPKGVSLKPGGQVAQTGNKHAATITAITLSVSAADMTTITQPVSLTTLDATIDVPVGTARTFTALVKTDIGGSFTGSHTTDVSGASLSVSISMAISSALISGKLSAAVSKPGGKAAISTWAGAKIEVFDSTGALVGTGTAAADGTYSVDVPDGANYFVRAQIGNMVLKAYVSGTSGATAVNVNTTSTAAVMVLAQSLGVANLGDSGVSGAAAIAAANISTLYASILANPNLAVAAAALENEITANYDPNGTTPSVGTAGTAATSSISLIVSAVAPPSTTTVSPPAAPTGVWVSAGNAQAFIGWTAVSGATSYNVYYRTTAGVTTANGTKVTGATNGGAITGLTNGTTYYFIVTAVGAGGESAASSEVSATPQVPAPPSAPTGVMALPGNGQATMSWNAASGATSYNVYYRTASGVTTANGTKVTGATNGGAITSLTNGTTYYFIVTAVGAGGESAVSGEVFAKPAYLMGGGVQNGGLALNNAATASTVAVSTLAGLALIAGTTDATGSAARFGRPYGITTDGTNLFVADQANNTIRKIVISSGVVTTLAGSGVAAETDGTGTGASFNNPTGITTDGTNLFVTDRLGNTIRKVVIATSVVTTLAGSGVAGAANGTGTAATFNSPNGIVTDGANLYVADQTNGSIRKIAVSTGVVTTFATGFTAPRGITSDGTNLYVANSGGNIIQKIVISTGVVTTLAGSGVAGSADGTGTAATFKLPLGITTDGTNLFVVDNNNYTIRQIVISTGVVSTIAGLALTTGSTDGLGSAARFNFPNGIITNGSNLFVADGNNFTVRAIASACVTWTARTSGTANILYAVASSGTGLAAVGAGTTLLSSPDGIAWTTRADPTGWAYDMFGIAWSGTQFATGGVAGTVLTSPTGAAWTLRAFSTANDINGLVWNGTQFVAVGALGSAEINTSPNGITWTARTPSTANVLKGVAWGGNQFVAVGALGTVVTSPDGITWTVQASGTANALNGVACSSAICVAVGSAVATPFHTIISSPDGITWTARTSTATNTLNAVNWNGTQFVAVGAAGAILTSPDGITWTARTSGTANALNGITWDGAKCIAVGAGGTILTSQ